MVVSAVVVVALFRLTLFQGWTFIGDSDRLNAYLPVRLFEVASIWERGSVATWNEQQFLGQGPFGLHWVQPGLTPFPYFLALFPASELYRAIDVASIGLVVLAVVPTYLCLRVYSAGPVPAAVSTLLYILSAHAIMRIAQADLQLLALSAVPLALGLVRATSRRTAAACFLGLVACWAGLVLLTILQEVVYISILLGAYALYRTVRWRDPWPLLVVALGFATGALIGLPRIVTVGLDFLEVSRSAGNVRTVPVEALRFFGDGLLGRSFPEQSIVLRGPLNMHEGVQLLGSSLAALATVAYGLVGPSRARRLWGVALVAILSVALSPYLARYYDLGLGRLAFPSPVLRALLVNLAVIGPTLWALSRLAARRADSVRSASEDSIEAVSETRAAAHDGPFFLGFVVLALAAILVPEAGTLLYYGFMRVDFTHARLSIAMTLPLAALVTIFLSYFVPARPAPVTLRWLAGGAGLGLALWLARELAAEAVVARVGPALELARSSPRLLTLEAIRVLIGLLVVVLACLLLRRRARASSLTIAGGALAGWIGLEVFATADFRLGGPHTREQQAPFEAHSFLNAPPGTLRPPSPAERAAVQARLEVDRFRSVLYQDRTQFPVLLEPHLAAFWGLRLVEGYTTGLPRRLGMLPWPEKSVGLRELEISWTRAPATPPWRLLAALNVKYAVLVDRSLWFNPAPGAADPPVDPARLRVLENPYPVAPRAFFAAGVAPAGRTPRFPGDDGRRPAPADPRVDDPTTRSVVEGFDAERPFATAGTLDAQFDRDRVSVRVDAAHEDRFLVLNELYHPAWQARVDGQPAPIYPTNVVMRGILVPAGATIIELRFVPFVTSPLGLSIFAAGLAATVLGWWGLRRLTAR